MKKLIICSMILLAVLLSGACKSKPTPVPAPASTRMSATGAASEAATPPGNTTTATVIPDTSIGSAYGTATGTTSGTASGTASSTTSRTTSDTASGTTAGNINNRHQSGVILDGATSYIVRMGDTLNDIARQTYRDGSLYPLISMVSSEVIDPDIILPGMHLTIPAFSVNMNDPEAKAAINRYFLQIAQFEEQLGRHETAEMIRNHTR